MIKSIYDDKDKFYWHKYFCDNCFDQLKYGEIYRKKIYIYEIDLCYLCWKNWKKILGE